MSEATPMNLEARITRLEHEARIWRTAAIALGAMLVSVFGIAAVPRPAPDVAKPQLDRQFVSKALQTQSLEIVNEQGLPAIVLHAGKGGGMVTTFTSTGQPAVVLAATADGGAIQARGAGGKPAAELGASDRHQHGMLAVYQADGSQAVRLTAGQDGGRLLTFNGKGEATVMLSSDDAGAGLVDVLDGKRGIAVELGVEQGTGTVQALTIEHAE